MIGGATARGEAGAEYEQVHKIALRDARVRDAFARANERLDARIVELDPALAGYVRTHPSGRGEPEPAAAAVPRKPFVQPKPAVAAAKPKKPAPVVGQRTHVVAAGETLSAIATKYGVTVQSLETANQIQDARKLRAGQTLVVP